MKYIVLIFWICMGGFIPNSAHGQEAKVSLNTSTILIGERIEYTIRAFAPAGGYKMDVILPDSIPHFEIIERGFVAPLKGQPKIIEQTITFTSFDSGGWMMPVIPVKLTKGSDEIILSTPSVLVQVGYAPEDSDELKDIKPLLAAEASTSWWPYIIIGALMLLIIIAYMLYRYFQRNKYISEDLPTSTSAYEDAMRALDSLQPSSEKPKFFYAGLSDVFKLYLQQLHAVPILPKTTDEVLLWMNQHTSAENVSNTANVLRMADAAKFAKYKPDVNMQQESLELLRKVIKGIHQKSSQQ